MEKRDVDSDIEGWQEIRDRPNIVMPYVDHKHEIAELRRQITAYQIAKDNLELRLTLASYEENWRAEPSVIRIAAEITKIANSGWQVY
jgi:hypothetical protein